MKHDGASKAAARAAAGLEKPVGFAQRWLSRLFAQAAEELQPLIRSCLLCSGAGQQERSLPAQV